jgi:hypothetical protein
VPTLLPGPFFPVCEKSSHSIAEFRHSLPPGQNNPAGVAGTRFLTNRQSIPESGPILDGIVFDLVPRLP